MTILEFTRTAIDDVIVVDRHRREDQRGFLSRIFCSEQFAAAGLTLPIAQINHTLTRTRGTIRGLHYQRPPHAEIKLVNCLRGQVFDVALDLRRGSPTFLHWHAEILSAENCRGLLIPRGVAHGFQTLQDDCELVYLHSNAYDADAEAAVHFRDPLAAIDWPIEVSDISPRDAKHAPLTPQFQGV